MQNFFNGTPSQRVPALRSPEEYELERLLVSLLSNVVARRPVTGFTVEFSRISETLDSDDDLCRRVMLGAGGSPQGDGIWIFRGGRKPLFGSWLEPMLEEMEAILSVYRPV